MFIVAIFLFIIRNFIGGFIFPIVVGIVFGILITFIPIKYFTLIYLTGGAFVGFYHFYLSPNIEMLPLLPVKFLVGYGAYGITALTIKTIRVIIKK